MLKLEDREWKEFKIGDIFEVSGTTTTKPTDLIKDGLIPRITCSSIDNGFDNTYQNIATENGGVLTVDSATIGSVLYQVADFIATDHVEKIYFKDKFINKYVGKFLVSAITNSIGNKYNYGYKFSQFRIKRQTILLPTTSNGEPDYEFMEEYIKEREEQKLEEYVSFARKEIEKIEKKIVETNTNHKWKEFYLRDLFEIYHGKRLVKEKRKDGETPLLTASAINEGVSDFIEDISMKKYKNVITVDMFGHSFYHKYECCGDDNIYFFVNDKLDDEVKQFISVCINRNSNKYSYGKQFREKNALNERVLLPVDKNGTLYIVYIKQYIDIQDVDILFKLSECKLSDQEWKEFKIEELFFTERGNAKDIGNKIEGEKVVLISAMDNNNGLNKIVNPNQKEKVFKNTYAINNNGNGLCLTYYHKYSFISSTDVTILHCKNKQLQNENIAQFIITSIQEQKQKYSYGYKMNNTRLTNQIIILPIDNLNNPDYKFMENYIQNLKLQKLNNYLNFLTK